MEFCADDNTLLIGVVVVVGVCVVVVVCGDVVALIVVDGDPVFAVVPTEDNDEPARTADRKFNGRLEACGVKLV